MTKIEQLREENAGPATLELYGMLKKNWAGCLIFTRFLDILQQP